MAQSAQNFDAMRQDAIRRSREMQRRAAPLPGELTGILDSLHFGDELHSLLHDWDTEKIALAGLLYLLWKEGADPVLLLAIAYILL